MNEGTLEVMALARGEDLFAGDGIGESLEGEVTVLGCDGRPIEAGLDSFDKVRHELSQ